MKKMLSVLMILGWALTVSGCGFAREEAEPVSRELAVLMYHHFEDDENGFIFVSEERFREQLTALKHEGYETITLEQLLTFVEENGPLPEKPLLITMDDGYASNLELAAPILEELSMTATVFVVGISEGETHYPHTGAAFENPHFSYADALPWIQRGVIDVQSHTYDLHQLERDGFSGRDGVLRKAEESLEAYTAAILADCQRFKESRDEKGLTELVAIAYPYGFYTPEIDKVLESEFKLSFTTKEMVNVVTQGELSSLRMLGRMNVSGGYTGELLVEKLGTLPLRER